MNYGNALLSKVIDNNDPAALRRFGIEEYHLGSEGERKAFRFISDYADQNRGQAPDYRRVVSEVSQFDYVAAVEDSYEYLTKQIKSNAAKREIIEMINSDDTEKSLNEKDGESFILDLQNKIHSIKMRTSVRDKVGTDIKQDANKFLNEYQKRKSGESLKTWRSRFDLINDISNGYTSSNVFVWFAKSGRGKSILTLEEGVESAMQGANVLIWAMEMGWYEVMVRIYTSISGRKGFVEHEHNGLPIDAGFDSKEIRRGTLSEEFEKGFETFLTMINDIIPGNIVVRAVDDDDFDCRDLNQLESDIIATKADVVIIDPFYYLDYEKSGERTTGAGATETSKKLRRLAGKTKTVIHAITQAEEIRSDEADDGEDRVIHLPRRADVKKTKQLLEDAALLIAADTIAEEGIGMISLVKGRDGGEGQSAEILYLPSIGVVKQMDIGEAISGQFTKNF